MGKVAPSRKLFRFAPFPAFGGCYFGIKLKPVFWPAWFETVAAVNHGPLIDLSQPLRRQLVLGTRLLILDPVSFRP
jgi:hypothetical protein